MNAEAAAVLIAAILTQGTVQTVKAALAYRAGRRRDETRKAAGNG